MQNYIFKKIINFFKKWLFWGIFSNVTVSFPPPGAKIAPPPLEKKSESPPPAGPFCTPLLPLTPCPSMDTDSALEKTSKPSQKSSPGSFPHHQSP